jgi:hypothetical protein
MFLKFNVNILIYLYLKNKMSLYLLYETALGYCLFEVNGYEEIQQKVIFIIKKINLYYLSIV